MNIEDFRLRLKKAMAIKGMTQKDIQRETGIHQVTLSTFLSGKSGINGSTLLALLPLVFPEIAEKTEQLEQ